MCLRSAGNAKHVTDLSIRPFVDLILFLRRRTGRGFPFLVVFFETGVTQEGSCRKVIASTHSLRSTNTIPGGAAGCRLKSCLLSPGFRRCFPIWNGIQKGLGQKCWRLRCCAEQSCSSSRRVCGRRSPRVTRLRRGGSAPRGGGRRWLRPRRPCLSTCSSTCGTESGSAAVMSR